MSDTLERFQKECDDARRAVLDVMVRPYKLETATAALDRLCRAHEALAKAQECSRVTELYEGQKREFRATAYREAEKFGGDVELIQRWQGYPPGPPETFDYAEAVAAIVMQLTREGITAWNGDATYCIAHMLKAQFDRWDKLRALRAPAPVREER